MFDLSHLYTYGFFFLWILATGMGLPCPEEIPVVTAGVMIGTSDAGLQWWIMLPVLIAATMELVIGCDIGNGLLGNMCYSLPTTRELPGLLECKEHREVTRLGRIQQAGTQVNGLEARPDHSFSNNGATQPEKKGLFLGSDSHVKCTGIAICGQP